MYVLRSRSRRRLLEENSRSRLETGRVRNPALKSLSFQNWINFKWLRCLAEADLHLYFFIEKFLLNAKYCVRYTVLCRVITA